MKDRTQKTVSESEPIVGVLIPSGWGDGFIVTEISLACDGEREIAITNLDAQPGLHELLRKRVQVVGTLKQSGQCETLDISSYQVLDENDPNEFETKGS